MGIAQIFGSCIIRSNTQNYNKSTSTKKNQNEQKQWQKSIVENRKRAVRTMILYPTNALVQDQLSRLLRAINTLNKGMNGNRVYIGQYTSDTYGIKLGS